MTRARTLAASFLLALAVAFAQTAPVMTGSFIQLNSQLAGFSTEAWETELGYMQQIGMDTIIIQYSRYGESVYFPAETTASRASEIPDEAIGTLTWEGNTDGRYLRLTVQPNTREWTMLPEIRVFANGANVALGRPYTLSPSPDPRYPDDAGKLTDGQANFAWPDMVGWSTPGEQIVITLELEEDVNISRIEVDFMRSDISGVELPASYAVATSADGEAFTATGQVATWAGVEAEVREPIKNILAVAEALGMDVYIGLGLDPTFWQGVFDPEEAARQNIATMAQLYALYGDFSSLAGWYIPEEIDDRSFVTPERHQAMISYLAAVTDAAHEQTGKPVMVAPYFGMSPNAEAYARWWDVTLAEVDLDIIALQDGVGTRRTTIEEGAAVFEALAEVTARHGVALWSDLEVFDQIQGWPVDDRPWRAVPASFERVSRQLELEAPHVSKIVVFDFTHYMSPRLGGEAQALYQDYQASLEE